MKLENKEGRDFYYALTLVGEAGKIIMETQTHWVGTSETNPPTELREPRPVYRDFAKLWESIHQPYSIVDSLDEFPSFWINGGHALVRAWIFEEIFGHLRNPRPSYPIGKAGFIGGELLDDGAFRRAPTPKLRMRILKRDKGRCRICGRRPEDDVDVQLHVHHIRPWARGGVTDPRNLITLCHTCHSGLEPHEDLSLLDYIEEKRDQTDLIEKELRKHIEGVNEYRRISREEMNC